MDQFVGKVIILFVLSIGCVLSHRPPARPPLTPSVVGQILHRFGNRVPVQAVSIDLSGDHTGMDEEPERRKHLYTDITFQYFNQ
jgi:hypothetical protein